MIWKSLRIKSINKQNFTIHYKKNERHIVNNTIHWYEFNPIWIIKSTLRARFLKKVYTEFPHLQCHGCGMGLIEYSIKDPNKHYNSKSKRWLVCKDCFNFYDQYGSARKVKLK